jgi:hypothetical protein
MTAVRAYVTITITITITFTTNSTIFIIIITNSTITNTITIIITSTITITIIYQVDITQSGPAVLAVAVVFTILGTLLNMFAMGIVVEWVQSKQEEYSKKFDKLTERGHIVIIGVLLHHHNPYSVTP